MLCWCKTNVQELNCKVRELGDGQDDELNHSKAPTSRLLRHWGTSWMNLCTIKKKNHTTRNQDQYFQRKIRCDLIGLEVIETNKKCITTFGFTSWVGPSVSTLNFVRYNWRINNWHWWKWCYTFLVEPKETCISIISRSFSDLWSSKSAHELAASVTLEIVWNFSLVWYLLS